MEASVFAESVKRLYNDGYIEKDKIMELRKNGKLSIEEVNFILDETNLDKAH